MTASLLFCVGPLTILGSLSDGLGRGADQLSSSRCWTGSPRSPSPRRSAWGVAASAVACWWCRAAHPGRGDARRRAAGRARRRAHRHRRPHAGRRRAAAAADPATCRSATCSPPWSSRRCSCWWSRRSADLGRCGSHIPRCLQKVRCDPLTDLDVAAEVGRLDRRRRRPARRRCPRGRSRRSRGCRPGAARLSACAAFCSTSSTVVPWALISVMIAKICWISLGASPIDGSSRSSSRGRAISARPIASICCSPPDIVPAAWLTRSLSRGNSVKTRSRSSAYGRGLAVGADVGAHVEVLPDRHAGEAAAALGRLADAELHALVRRQVGDVLAVEDDLALRGPCAARRWSSSWWSCPRRWRRSA